MWQSNADDRDTPAILAWNGYVSLRRLKPWDRGQFVAGMSETAVVVKESISNTPLRRSKTTTKSQQQQQQQQQKDTL